MFIGTDKWRGNDSRPRTRSFLFTKRMSYVPLLTFTGDIWPVMFLRHSRRFAFNFIYKLRWNPDQVDCVRPLTDTVTAFHTVFAPIPGIVWHSCTNVLPGEWSRGYGRQFVNVFSHSRSFILQDITKYMADIHRIFDSILDIKTIKNVMLAHAPKRVF